MPDLSKPIPADETDLVGTATIWDTAAMAGWLRDAKASHTAFEAAQGPDPDWPAYYARYIVMRMILSGVLAARPKGSMDPADPVPDPAEHEGPADLGGGFYFRGDVY